MIVVHPLMPFVTKRKNMDNFDITEEQLTQMMSAKADDGRVKDLLEKKKAEREAKLQAEAITKLNEERKSVEKFKGKIGAKLAKLAKPTSLNEGTPFPSAQNGPSVNDEHEPNSLEWQPISFGQLVRDYPKSTAINDLYTYVHSAMQQPGMSFGLLGEKGTEFLIKADRSGNLFKAFPPSGYQAFTNIGLNPDYDQDKTDDAEVETAAKPLHIPTSEVKDKLYKDSEFGVSENIDYIEEAPVVKESVFFSLFTKDELKTVQLSENLSVKDANSLLFLSQKKLNKTSEPIYEKIADVLSGVIAEALLFKRELIPLGKITRKIG